MVLCVCRYERYVDSSYLHSQSSSARSAISRIYDSFFSRAVSFWLAGSDAAVSCFLRGMDGHKVIDKITPLHYRDARAALVGLALGIQKTARIQSTTDATPNRDRGVGCIVCCRVQWLDHFYPPPPTSTLSHVLGYYKLLLLLNKLFFTNIYVR